MAVDATTTATTAQSANALSRSTLADNFDTFLTLLTAQLQNQDPLSPMDSNQFTQQLVQFSQVEQQIRTNEQLDSLITQNKAALSGTALSYLGRDAIMQSDRTVLSNSAAVWSYNMPDDAKNLTIEVRDSTGRTVYSTTTADRSQGSHLFSWDGRNASGTAQADGVYQLVVTAKDGDDASMTVPITTRETVIGIDLTSENPYVMTASGSHDLSTIHAILDN